MKEYRISARLPEDLKKRLEAAEKKLGIDQALIARKCIEALVDYVEEKENLKASITGNVPKALS